MAQDINFLNPINVGAPGSAPIPPEVAQQGAHQAQTSRGGFQPIAPIGMQRQQYDEFGNPIISPLAQKESFNPPKPPPPHVLERLVKEEEEYEGPTKGSKKFPKSPPPPPPASEKLGRTMKKKKPSPHSPPPPSPPSPPSPPPTIYKIPKKPISKEKKIEQDIWDNPSRI